MEPISDHLSYELQWLQPKGLNRSFELHSGVTLVARLDFQSAWGSLAIAATAAQSWSFKRVGFFKTRVTARIAGQPDDIAIFHPNWLGEGWIEIAGGRRYFWKSANFWASRFVISTEDGSPIITYQEGVEHPKFADWFKTQAGVRVEYPARGLPETPMLILLGWYLIVLHQEDSAAAGGAVAATA